MKVNDLFLEKVDIIGNLFPGLLVFFNIAMLNDFFFTNIDFVELYNNFQIIIILLILVVSYILGDINSFISFRFRDITNIILDKDMTMRKFLIRKPNSEKMISFFEKEFGEESLKRNYWKFHFYCREIIIDKHTMGHKHAEQIALKVRLSISLFFPTILFGINSLISPNINNILGYILFSFAILFFVNAEKRKREEAYVIFLNYYKDKSNDK